MSYVRVARTSRSWRENGVEIFSRRFSGTTSFTPTCTPATFSCRSTTPRIRAMRPWDFGIVGTLQPRDQHYLAENFMAFFNRDYGRVAQLHIESGWVPKGTRVDELESAVRTVCEPIYKQAAEGNLFSRRCCCG